MRLVDTTAAWIRNDRLRRLSYFVFALIAAVLIFFPRPYVARAKVLPQDTSSAGLGQVVSALGGQLQNFASLLTGGRPANDLYLIIGRSDTVLDDVIGNLKLVNSNGPYTSVREAKLALLRQVDVRLLLGGVIEVETRSHDPQEAQSLTAAYVRAISKEISQLSRETISRKREIVQGRLKRAAEQVTETEARLDAFRRQNHLASPEAQLGSEMALRANLQAQLQAREAELKMVQQSAGPENNRLLSLQAEIGSLRQQLARTNQPVMGLGGPTVASLSELESRYLNLFRDYRLAQALYEVYSRANEQSEVESLVAETASYIQVVEQAHLDPDRKVNIWALGLFACIVLLSLFTEWYAPRTGLFRRGEVEKSPDVLVHE